MPLRLEVTSPEEPALRVFRYEFDADRAQILLGRRGGVDVLLPDPRVSSVHARIELRGGEYFLSDEGSTNGTRVNGARLSEGQQWRLRGGDRISIGNFSLVVEFSTQESIRAETSISMAREMVRGVLQRVGPGESLPNLVVTDGPQTGVRFVLAEPARTYLLGRSPAGDLRLDEIDMWREHAALVRDDNGVTVRAVTPREPEQPLLVDGRRVVAAHLLRDGETITIAGVPLRFTDPAEVYLQRLESPDVPDQALPSLRLPALSRHNEYWLIGFGILVAILALVGFIVIWKW